MPEYFDAEGNAVDSEVVEGRMAQLPRKVVRRLEKEAEAGRQATAELEQLKRERAFVQAGVPVEDPRATYFIAGYQGEQSPDAIRTEWQRLFGSGANQQPSQIDYELQQQEAAQLLVGGPGSPAPDPLAQRNAELAGLSATDPLYTQKFDAIAAKYGTRTKAF